MLHAVEKSFSKLLNDHQTLSWQRFSQQYPDITQVLSVSQLNDFKRAITLSDFILNSALQAPEIVIELFSSNDIYQPSMPNYASLLATALKDCESEQTLHRILRQCRLREMVKIAFADMVCNYPLVDSLARLSKLADELILAALAWLNQFCQKKWGIPVDKDGKEQCLLVYGMGKLGGNELNFSSDIDLIFVYPKSGETTGMRRSIDNQLFFTRLAQKLIAALHNQTADGFVYRVDMRLRPFGESGPLVLTFNAMEDYYQEQGRDWERYAMLKARLVGEGEFHKKLSTLLRPFVYRRYIDFSVIESLRRMKAMIAQEVRRKQLVNNIKLGAGGIREIEFIVQVFQLIRGGRDVNLQQRNLLTVLPLLVNSGVIDDKSELILKRSYCFLRRVENIIQAFNDQQTQTLPSTALDQERLLHILGNEEFNDWLSFQASLNGYMNDVHQEFMLLIGEDTPNHQKQDSHWLTLWDCQWDDNEAVSWIQEIDENCDAEKFWLVLRDFRADALKRSLGQRGRETLDKLMPLLLCHIQQHGLNVQTLANVLSVFSCVLTRTAYMELLFENEGALKHLIKLCEKSQWVTEYIAKYPILLDELIDPKLLHTPPELKGYHFELRQAMLRIPEDDLEAQMDALRQFKQAQQLRIAAADISGVLPVTKVSDHLTALAEAILETVVNIAWQSISDRLGIPLSLEGTNNKGFGIVGYGKMGGMELGYASDLDLVFLHNNKDNEQTNGPKPVSAGQFYLKLAQRIMLIFNTRTASGILYELDLRLRPSGNSGLLVVNVNTFRDYLHEDAWTWEHQALVRARFINGESDLKNAFDSIRRDVLSLVRDKDVLTNDVDTMREKMRNHLDKSDVSSIDIKQGRGGLVDIEFLAQYFVLLHSHHCENISQYSDNIHIFEQLAQSNLITENQRATLVDIYCDFRDQGHRATIKGTKQVIAREGVETKLAAINTITRECGLFLNNE